MPTFLPWQSLLLALADIMNQSGFFVGGHGRTRIGDPLRDGLHSPDDPAQLIPQGLANHPVQDVQLGGREDGLAAALGLGLCGLGLLGEAHLDNNPE